MSEKRGMREMFYDQRAARFRARMVAAAGDNPEVREYADRVWERYYGEKAFIRQLPEDLADTEISYWEESP